MLKWCVFSALWILGLGLADAMTDGEAGGIGSRLAFFGGMWMLACVAARDFIAGYQERRKRLERTEP